MVKQRLNNRQKHLEGLKSAIDSNNVKEYSGRISETNNEIKFLKELLKQLGE